MSDFYDTRGPSASGLRVLVSGRIGPGAQGL